MKVRYVINGKSHDECPRSAADAARLRDILDSARAPGARTDATFLRGHCNGSQFEDDPARGDYYRQVAEAAGADVTGKVYLSGLAAYPGDPEAWVSGTGDVRRVCEERGYSCDGDVKVKGPGVTKAPEPTPVADDIAEAEVSRMVRADPGLKRKKRRELKEAVIDKHRGKA